MAHIPYGQGFIKHDLYRHVCIKFKDFSRTSNRKDTPTVLKDYKFMKNTDLLVEILL